MSKIYFIPDVHLQEQSPRSRKDAYPTTILEKLDFIVEYVNNKTPVCIICPEHGEFWQRPNDHFRPQGCPSCGHNLSRAENEISDFITELLGNKKVTKRDKVILDGLEIDILVPSLKLLDFEVVLV